LSANKKMRTLARGVLELPGVLAYGQSTEDAIARVKALALRVIAEQIEHGEQGAVQSTGI